MPRQTVVLPPIVSYKPGSYKLPDGRWYSAQLYVNSGDAVVIRNPSNKFTAAYGPDDIQCFVIEQDTFSVVLNVDITGNRQVTKAFAKHLYRCGNFLLLDYRHVMAPVADALLGNSRGFGPRMPAMENSMLVKPRTGPVVRVPGTRRAFEEAMLPLFGDCPEVADKIKHGKWGKQHMQKILLAYQHWQQTNSTSLK